MINTNFITPEEQPIAVVCWKDNLYYVFNVGLEEILEEGHRCRRAQYRDELGRKCTIWPKSKNIHFLN